MCDIIVSIKGKSHFIGQFHDIIERITVGFFLHYEGHESFALRKENIKKFSTLRIMIFRYLNITNLVTLIDSPDQNWLMSVRPHPDKL